MTLGDLINRGMKNPIFEGPIDTLEEEVEDEFVSAQNNYNSLVEQKNQIYGRIQNLYGKTNFLTRGLGPVGTFLSKLFRGNKGNLYQLSQYKTHLAKVDAQLNYNRKLLNHQINRKLQTAQVDAYIRHDESPYGSALEVANTYADLVHAAKNYLRTSRSYQSGSTWAIPFAETVGYFKKRKLRKILRQMNVMKKRYGHVLKHFYAGASQPEISKGFLHPVYMFMDGTGITFENYFQDKSLSKTEKQLYSEEKMYFGKRRPIKRYKR